MKSNLFKILLASTAFSVLAVSCRKDKDNKTTEDTGYAADHAALERGFDDVQDLADHAATQGSVGMKGLSLCATVTHDTTVSPRMLTIDFGAANCQCADGKNRRGKILVSYTGRYKDAGSVHSISFDNYFVNDNQLTGTKTVTNMGTNSSGDVWYNIQVNGSMVLANGTRTWTSERTRTWTQGYDTPTWTDDEYDITGTATVTRANGNVFNVAITTPLHIAASCNWIQSGVVSITPQNGNVRTLDYGTTGCDNDATVTVNGNTYTVELP